MREKNSRQAERIGSNSNEEGNAQHAAPELRRSRNTAYEASRRWSAVEVLNNLKCVHA